MSVDISATVLAREHAVQPREHVVHFYEHDAQLTDAVVPFLAAGLNADEAVIVVASAAHLRAFVRGLADIAIDVPEASLSDALIVLDAADTLDALVHDGEIDAAAFATVVGAPIRRAVEAGRNVRVYGEMVSLLWQAGDVLTAIKLEERWNELAAELPFALFCSYAAASMEGSEHVDALHQVCALHTSALPQASEQKIRDDERCCRELTAEFSAARDAPGRARRFVVAALRRWGIQETRVHEAALVLSELANNAVIHARSPFSIAISAQEPVLRIAVTDTRPQVDPGEAGSLVARFGHGLGVIEVLAREWGIEDRADAGKVVWAELAEA